MSKYLTLCLFLGLISCDEREDLISRQTEVLKQLNDLKMQAFDIPGFAHTKENMSVD